ncbi:BZ3500_MvSof-1268-A1-R1_Chr9g10485 [Microbotryum saponariae]|uniref:BZ3500_MvSof-1268-A1-R1_Chr9g10485 protein n=1 Tax=Microbotryum saponariae TaxID=289078 RepID=A0A2X0MZU7_9BASI|nr:BZ3501_MvSof-1269-A2-R1_Chr9g10234 [Microbotryum saponariae]SDA00172.1 BZ3500_MvSof-1268-A1-R1_Chr9g10485 [Microbotryum saponariae]
MSTSVTNRTPNAPTSRFINYAPPKLASRVTHSRTASTSNAISNTANTTSTTLAAAAGGAAGAGGATTGTMTAAPIGTKRRSHLHSFGGLIRGDTPRFNLEGLDRLTNKRERSLVDEDDQDAVLVVEPPTTRAATGTSSLTTMTTATTTTRGGSASATHAQAPPPRKRRVLVDTTQQDGVVDLTHTSMTPAESLASAKARWEAEEDAAYRTIFGLDDNPLVSEDENGNLVLSRLKGRPSTRPGTTTASTTTTTGTGTTTTTSTTTAATTVLTSSKRSRNACRQTIEEINCDYEIAFNPTGPIAMKAAEDARKLATATAAKTTQVGGGGGATKDHKKSMRQERAEKHDKLVQESATWRSKYKKAFPSFVFYFDALDVSTELHLIRQVERLGASVDNFFSKKVTHVVTSRPVPSTNNKENSPSVTAASKSASAAAHATNNPGPVSMQHDSTAGPLRTKKLAASNKSPTTYALPNGQKLRPFGEGLDKNPFIDSQDILCKAVDFKLKIWHLDKIHLILTRINSHSPSKNSAETTRPAAGTQGLSLPSLLRDEQLYGTRERDPFVPRSDMYYFGPKSVYLLVEDSTGEHRPIVTKEYERPRRHEDPAWPVLWGGVEGRGGFYHFEGEIKYERRKPPAPKLDPSTTSRNGKSLKAIQAMGATGGHAVAANRAVGVAGGNAGSAPNLRRSLSLQAMTRGGKTGLVGADSRGASGTSKEPEYLAASGNSQIITSTTATSTRSGAPVGRLGHGVVDKRLAVLSQRTVTSLGGNSTSGARPAPAEFSATGSSRHLAIPGAALGGNLQGKLKRSASVDAGLNARMPPPRDEPKKPGYCENCRMKYEDFKDHVVASKHRRFAQNPKNWYELDNLLSLISRPLAVQSSEDEDEEMEEDEWDESDADAQFESSQPSSAEDFLDGVGDDSGFHEGVGSDSCASDQED